MRPPLFFSLRSILHRRAVALFLLPLLFPKLALLLSLQLFSSLRPFFDFFALLLLLLMQVVKVKAAFALLLLLKVVVQRGPRRRRRRLQLLLLLLLMVMTTLVVEVELVLLFILS